MTEPFAPSKTELLELLRRTGDEFVAAVHAQPANSLLSGRYEHGWTARQILAHVAAIEWTYPRLIDIARDAVAGPKPADGKPNREIRDGIDGYNARQVEKRANASIDDLVNEFAANRAQTIAAIEAADDGLLATPLTSSGGRSGPLAQVFREVAVDHVRAHLADILGP
ncbi:MAG: DinB family protein [Chloroflexi bacterium]|nr:DinB family protein [Chloroflexota bacterium]